MSGEPRRRNPGVHVEMTASEYERYRDEYCGLCLACGEIQEGGCEPDARGYECESCGENRVYGIEESLMMGRITITSDE
jgi:hypothetical protein